MNPQSASDLTQSADDEFRQKTLIVCVIFFAINCTGAYAFSFLAGLNKSYLVGAAAVALATPVAFVSAWFRWHMRAVTKLVIYICACAVVLMVAFQGGLTGVFLPLLASPPLACALLFGSRDTLKFSVALILGIVALYVLDPMLPSGTLDSQSILNANMIVVGILLSQIVVGIVVLKNETDRRDEKLRVLLAERDHAANHDALTGLANRAAVNDYLARLDPNTHAVDIHLVDLDGFKAVNDTHGHAAGDRVLVNVADVIRTVAKGANLIARLGGDEFLVICNNKVDGPEKQLRNAFLGEKLAAALVLNGGTEANKCMVSASVGSARFPDDGATGSQVMKNADRALTAPRSGEKPEVLSSGAIRIWIA